MIKTGNSAKSIISISNNWKDYELLGYSNGMKQEHWGGYILVRPDRNLLLHKQPETEFERYDAYYHIDSPCPHVIPEQNPQKKGRWEFKNRLPGFWTIGYRDLIFKIQLTNSKQVGLFPEQAANWDWISEKIKNANREINVLNLFGYTGGSTISAAKNGALVCHVDSSKNAVEWCKENACLSGLKNHHIRYIVDDCVKFVEREIKRNKKYNAVIMDPPSFGHGKKGKIWKFENNLRDLLEKCQKILSENPLFFLITAHTNGFPENILGTMLKEIMKNYNGTVSAGKLGIPVKKDKNILLCGIYARWEGNYK